MGRGAALALVVALVAACGGDGSGSPTATLEPGPTTERTTTTLSPEDEVEAAYLKSWEVYADAMRTFDTSRLDEVYVDEALAVRLDEVADLAAAGTPARMSVDHRIQYVRILENGEATVRDRYVNHSVLLDASGQPTEEDPNETLDYEYVLRNKEGSWKVALVIPH